MSERAVIVTGASSGIGLAIAPVLGEEAHGLTVAANLVSEDDVQRVVQAHQARFGTEDIDEAVRFLLRLSPNRVAPELDFQHATESL